MMKTRLLTYHLNLLSAAVLAVAALASCTHNDGDIGPWFGLWQVESIDIDGVSLEGYEQNVFFSFQSTVCEMQRVGDHHAVEQTFARWEATGDALIINFPDEDYQPLSGLPGFGQSNRFTYTFSPGGNLTLTGNTTPHSLVTYHLKKYPD